MKKPILILASLLIAILVAIKVFVPFFYDDYIFSRFCDKSTEYFGKNWKPVNSLEECEFYREIRYKSDGTPIGEVKDFYKSGQLQWIGHISNVKPFTREGKCLNYFQNGQLASEGEFKFGEKFGLHKHYYENGQLKQSGEFTFGLRNGLFSFYRENGVKYYQSICSGDSIIYKGLELEKVQDKYDIETIKQAGTYFLAAEKDFKNSDFQQSAQNCTQSLSIIPDNSYIIFHRGKSYLQDSTTINESRMDFESALTLNFPEPYKCHFNLGVGNKMQENWGTALLNYENAIQQVPNSQQGIEIKTISYFDKGECYSALDSNYQAIDSYTEAINLDATNPAFYVSRAFVFLKTNDNSKLTNVIEDCTKSIELDSQNENAFAYRSMAYLKSDNLTYAKYDLEHALAINPYNELAISIRDEIREIEYAQYNPSPEPVDWGSLLNNAHTLYRIYETGKDLLNGRFKKAAKDLAEDYIWYKLFNN